MDRYVVIGNPVGHSKSPLIHASFAAATGQSLQYGTIEAPPGGFAPAVDAFRREGGLGLNVTTPFKLDAFAYATELGERARLAGAVNAMKFEGDRVLAENFDGIGLVHDIRHNLGFPMVGRRILLLGAGGAARGAVLPFLAEHPAALVIVNRTIAKAAALVQAFGGHGPLTATGFDDLVRLGGFDLVVNATSASLHAELPLIERDSFAPGSLAYELAYGRGLTPFLHVAQAAGTARLVDGVGMLVEQAAEAFTWWRGVRPATAALIERLTVPLE